VPSIRVRQQELWLNIECERLDGGPLPNGLQMVPWYGQTLICSPVTCIEYAPGGT